ncbi:227L [Invertebrate iridescent virus 6]|uniref:Uncharacterized protein 227L n=1 Tax=Invertebrate iridescent virus 6 TaxID=176652 RepID=227L_IIV6|nr:227L [Invertebrate iridescent virus 6]Q91FU5.1 RecName: Full=Uncharacterized protein 227L [Invertebrate iridescent virus 6]AAK82088.1 227L [Invertebrate iridescent virus 6]
MNQLNQFILIFLLLIVILFIFFLIPKKEPEIKTFAYEVPIRYSNPRSLYSLPKWKTFYGRNWL